MGKTSFEKGLEGKRRRNAIERALTQLAPYSGEDWGERALAASPAVLAGIGLLFALVLGVWLFSAGSRASREAGEL